MKTVCVEGAGFAGYDIHIGIGLLGDAAAHIFPFLKQGRTLIVSDQNVQDHRLVLEAALTAAGIAVHSLVLPAGEDQKSWDGLKAVTNAMVQSELDRKDLVIALGGGVIGDLTGLAAALYMRGIGFIQIPTTLLAQVDSSVGGKTAIDHPAGKNLIGAFHQPRLVLCDLKVLKTLPRREILCGYAEIIKYGLLGDKDFFAWLEAQGQAVIDLEPDALAFAVRRSVEMKADIVAADEREAGARALLNLGHTFGHALEAECGFGETLKHGEAVAVGMAQAFRFSAFQGLCPLDVAKRAVAAITMVGLPTEIAQIRNEAFDAARLLTHMGHDKKAEGGQLTLILAHQIGDAYVAKTVSHESVYDFLIKEGARPSSAIKGNLT